MEPEKEREKDPNDLFSAATAIVSCMYLPAACGAMQITRWAAAGVCNAAPSTDSTVTGAMGIFFCH
jgi:hypothetical protein